jgi:D-alanyl-D-alanine carboxypeptidase
MVFRAFLRLGLPVTLRFVIHRFTVCFIGRYYVIYPSSEVHSRGKNGRLSDTESSEDRLDFGNFMTPPAVPQIVFGASDCIHPDLQGKSIVPWWSFSKVAIAAAALSLVAKSKLQLDKAVGGQPFTLRHLLQHRSGLPDYGGLADYHGAVGNGEEPWSGEALLERVGIPAVGGVDTAALLFQPGCGWQYSNVGYLLVRRQIEAATGLPLGEALQRLVFTPLSVENVTLAETTSDLDATVWQNIAGYDPKWVFPGLLIGPAASAADFLFRLLTGSLLPPDLRDAMLVAHPIGDGTPDRPWTTAGYGLGLMMGAGDPPGLYVGHTGQGPGSTAAVYARVADGDRFAISAVVAAFADSDHPGAVERFAMTRAAESAELKG